jgi:SAM-dependent methyltransferase
VARRENRPVTGAGAWARRAAPAAAVFFWAACAAAATADQRDVPYVPTPAAVVDAMLKLAQVRERDYVIDLGSGDGRILIAAARRYGARGYGVEIDGDLVSTARAEAERQGVDGRVEFREENLYLTDFSRASVMTLYLYPKLLMDLRPRFLAQLRPGSRIVSHDFDMDDWRPDAQLTVPVPGKPYGPPRSEVFLWVVPANAAGAWRWRSDAGEVNLVLTQAFQVLEGKGRVGQHEARLEQGRMRGPEIRFILTSLAGGRAVRQEFSGRVNGDTIEGTTKAGGREAEWTARRIRRGSIRTGSEAATSEREQER